MPSYDSTARVPFASGGRVGSKKPKIKRIILWKGKAKDWPGAKKAAERTKKAKGGIASESARKKNKEAQAKSIGKAKKVLKGVASMYNPLTAAENIKSVGKKAIEKVKKHKKKIKKGVKTAAYILNPASVGFQLGKKFRDKKAKGGKADKNWIQGVNKSIKKRGTKGVCTGKKFGSASCPPGSKRYNLAKTFKKMARAKHASGGLVRFI